MVQIKNPLNIPTHDLDYVVKAVGTRWESLRDGRLLLTGGTGFIGKWLLATFLHANQVYDLRASIVIVSREPSSFLQSFPEVAKLSDIEWIHSDINTFKLGELPVCNFCIHAAADVARMITPSDTLRTAVSGTKKVLHAMTPTNEKHRLLLISSGAVYGEVDTSKSPVDERWIGAPNILHPSSAYGEGKRISELMCILAAEANPQLEVSIARCFAFLGPHLPLNRHFAIGNFISDVIEERDIKILGDGTPVRSYLYAADLAHWLWVILLRASNKKIYNVGGNQEISIAELAKLVNTVLGGTQKIIIDQRSRAENKKSAYVPSITRIKADLGLIPRINLVEAIERTATWYKNNIRDQP